MFPAELRGTALLEKGSMVCSNLSLTARICFVRCDNERAFDVRSCGGGLAPRDILKSVVAAPGKSVKNNRCSLSV